MKKTLKLNIGCGENKVKGFLNIDREKKVKPDLLFDVTKKALPFKTGVITQINCIHNLEHIEFKKWESVLGEFYRVLKMGGLLVLAYPEFEICSKFFLENYRGQKDFWRNTLYGRQLYPGDYHVTPMITKDVITFLMQIGFDNFKSAPEVDEPYNTFLTCVKSIQFTREDVIRQEVFGK